MAETKRARISSAASDQDEDDNLAVTKQSEIIPRKRSHYKSEGESEEDDFLESSFAKATEQEPESLPRFDEKQFINRDKEEKKIFPSVIEDRKISVMPPLKINPLFPIQRRAFDATLYAVSQFLERYLAMVPPGVAAPVEVQKIIMVLLF